MIVTLSKSGVWLKFTIGWTISFLLRLMPFRPPNIEPILAIQMPFAKKLGPMPAFMFAFLNIIIYDIITKKVGQWTVITALTYGGLALLSFWYFKHRTATPLHFASQAVIATLLYDAITGLSIGPLFFGQSLAEAFFGQIPFTLYHLIGNVTLGAIVSPLIYRWVTANPRLEIYSWRELILKYKADI